MTKEIIDNAMKDLAVGAKEIYGNKLKEVILFGSCARGDFAEGSDVDVMILLDVPREAIPAERAKIRPFMNKLDAKYEYELLFATIAKSFEEFNYWLEVTPFLQNVRKEGVNYA